MKRAGAVAQRNLFNIPVAHNTLPFRCTSEVYIHITKVKYIDRWSEGVKGGGFVFP